MATCRSHVGALASKHAVQVCLRCLIFSSMFAIADPFNMHDGQPTAHGEHASGAMPRRPSLEV
jgi:hypothetical protein